MKNFSSENLNPQVKKHLLALARNTIAYELRLTDNKIPLLEKDFEILKEKRGAFVTLELNGNLRGCIGNIYAIYPLETAIYKNSLSAAFDDPRFAPLAKDEFKNVKIEISVLTVPKKIKYKSAKEFLEKLTPLKDGVVIEKGYYSATYLPQVWEDLQNKEQFLSSLCIKAGLPSDEWKKGELEVFTYQAEVFKESDFE
jgi:hypothetical protein